MAFRRKVAPTSTLAGAELTAAMAGIGMNFATEPAPEPNIEDTLLAASAEAMERDDLRTLAVLVTWLSVHAPWVNAARLTRIVSAQASDRIKALWAALALHLKKDRRFSRLAGGYAGPQLDLLPVGTDFQVRRSGEDERFQGGPLRVPAHVLRDRRADVLSPMELARRHRAYRSRVLMGPSYRADMWAALEQDPSLSPAVLARRTYGSFATAWQVKHDWQVLAPMRPAAAAPGV